MKYWFSLLIFVLGISGAYAQFDKGDLFVGGNFGFSINNNESSNPSSSTQYSINLNPNLGYFISDRSAIGVIPQISFFKSTTTTSTDTKITRKDVSGGIGLFYRRYFPVIDNFYIFLEPRAIFNMDLVGNESPNYFGVSLMPGASYKISNKWMVEANFGGIAYNTTYGDIWTNQAYNNSRFSFDLITANSIGIIYFINQKEQ